MISNPDKSTPRNIKIEKKADKRILKLFPSINLFNSPRNTKNTCAFRLLCLKTVGDNNSITSANLHKTLNANYSEINKAIKDLTSKDLVRLRKEANKKVYNITPSGLLALTAFYDFNNWEKINSILTSPSNKNDPIAYAILTIGFCTDKTNQPKDILCKYASQGHIIENTEPNITAESLLSFYRQELRQLNPTPPSYLNVFKEFTTTGFQDVFKMLLLAIKPTTEDYNWLIQFFNEVSEFYFNPARIAYAKLIATNPLLQQNLEQYKKTQDQTIKKQGKDLEITFSIPGSGISKIDNMPPHLKAIGMRLIIEPTKFLTSELLNFYWKN